MGPTVTRPPDLGPGAGYHWRRGLAGLSHLFAKIVLNELGPHAFDGFYVAVLLARPWIDALHSLSRSDVVDARTSVTPLTTSRARYDLGEMQPFQNNVAENSSTPCRFRPVRCRLFPTGTSTFYRTGIFLGPASAKVAHAPHPASPMRLSAKSSFPFSSHSRQHQRGASASRQKSCSPRCAWESPSSIRSMSRVSPSRSDLTLFESQAVGQRASQDLPERRSRSCRFATASTKQKHSPKRRPLRGIAHRFPLVFDDVLRMPGPHL